MNNRFETQQAFDNELTISIAHAFNDIRAKNQRLIEINKELVEALTIAARQNSHDMLMTGDELRICEAALAKARGTE